jgi:hypothetical protein
VNNIVFADSSEKTITWKGEPFTDPNAKDFFGKPKSYGVAPSPLVLSVESGRGGKAPGGEVKIWRHVASSVSGAPEVVVVNKSGWLSTSYRANGENGVLSVEAATAALPERASSAEGLVRMKIGGEPAELKVILARKRSFRCDPDVVECRAGDAAEHTVKLESEESDKLTLVGAEIIEVPKNAKAEMQKGQSGGFCLKLSTARMPEGRYFLSVRATDERGVSSTSRVLIVVRK